MTDPGVLVCRTCSPVAFALHQNGHAIAIQFPIIETDPVDGWRTFSPINCPTCGDLLAWYPRDGERRSVDDMAVAVAKKIGPALVESFRDVKRARRIV